MQTRKEQSEQWLLDRECPPPAGEVMLTIERSFYTMGLSFCTLISTTQAGSNAEQGAKTMSKKPALSDVPENHLVVFQEKAIRHLWHNEEWWFAIVDVVAILTDSIQPEGYVKDLRRRDKELAQGWGQIATPLRIKTEGGAQRVNCANTEGLFRIIQSIPSPKAEPFKRWLAQVGYERVKEIENPELASARARELYQAKGYPQAWIEKRLRSISIRGELTDEWKQRGVQEGKEYSILTAEIARATFGE